MSTTQLTSFQRLFCESGGPQGSGEEVLYLPTIVESAESSPSAAKECALAIRKFLSKDNFSKPYVQYNAIMLIRILADNPGKTFTRNVDAKFVEAVKELLRVGRDPSVKQILMETLDTFAREKQGDEGLTNLLEMWKKEHERMMKIHVGHLLTLCSPTSLTSRQGSQATRTINTPTFDNQNYFARNHHTRRLPNLQELSSRIEEAKTSAKLLSQLIQSTPPSEVLGSDIIKEFADRCQSASRSIQAYMISENPSPDNDTMETLIETNDQLGRAMSQHQRAVLSARKAAGLGTGTSTPPLGKEGAYMSPSRTESGFAPPPGPPPSQAYNTTPLVAPVPTRKAISAKRATQIPLPGEIVPNLSDDEEASNPFSDPQQATSETPRNGHPPFPKDRPPVTTGQFNDRLGIEPYHPGFTETQNFVGRQHSSLGKVTMHAAGDEEEEAEGDDRGYGAQAEAKGPLYRY